MIGHPFFDDGHCKLHIKLPTSEDCDKRQGTIFSFRSTGDKSVVETSGSIWHAAISLAASLLQEPELLRGKNVLELGAGCGVVGIIAAALGANRVYITDLEVARSNIVYNIEANSPIWSEQGCDVQFRPLDWLELSHELPCFEDIDIVLGADIGYDLSLHEPIVQVLSKLNPRIGFILCEEVRWMDIFRWYQEAILSVYPDVHTCKIEIDCCQVESPDNGCSAVHVNYSREIEVKPTYGVDLGESECRKSEISLILVRDIVIMRTKC